MKKHWFKAKNYGWGWAPATWQGWLILGLFVLIVVKVFFEIDARSHSVSDTLMNFVPRLVSFTAILIFICYKTGEKPEWRWGRKK